ncbi:NfeD family protein [Jannaschia sp. R86511]|uniref:NfeD family protein n=1 Tax=Jannaschia sp. R86511 TaxID=3093853 RepID=UPI0036D3DF86
MQEFLRESQWLLWVAGALVLGLLELTALDFVFSMLVAGALAAALAAGLGFSFTVQAFVFTGVSLLGLLLVRPYLKRWAMRSNPDQPTNVDALTGRPALTLSVVDDRGGQVKLSGETWTARTADRGSRIDADVDVVVVRIEGATALVRAEQPAERPAEPHPQQHDPGAGDEPGRTPPPMEQ